MAAKKTKQQNETFTIKTEKLVEKVKELINEGNVRRIIIKDKNGKTFAEFPLSIGVVGAVFAPVLAAVGAIAALMVECTITVVRDES